MKRILNKTNQMGPTGITFIKKQC